MWNMNGRNIVPGGLGIIGGGGGFVRIALASCDVKSLPRFLHVM